MAYFTSKDGLEIFYRDQGKGAPVILIHGWPLNADMWENQELALLEAGLRVITYDRRGFGRSDYAANGYDYNTFAGDLNDLIVHLGLGSVALAGFSMGGGEIARNLSRFGGGKISRVSLISSVVPFLLRTSDNPEGVPAEILAEMQANLRGDHHAFLTGIGKEFFGSSLLRSAVSEEVLDWVAQMANQCSLRAEIECVNAFGKTDFRRDLEAFQVPTLVIHGDADQTVPLAATGRQVVQSVPSAELRVYDGAPHGLFVTHKDRLSADLVEFFGARASHESSPEMRSA